MLLQNQPWVVALIAAHPNQTVVGRTRLQKEVRLLQRLGFPTDYLYSIHFYGPYSEELQTDLGVIEAFGFIQETECEGRDGSRYYVMKAADSLPPADLEPYRPQIEHLQRAETVVLELAATYDAFREQGDDHSQSLERLRRKKGPKCGQGNEERALALLETLGLPVN
jgi:uncharacterized protein YwgA